MRAADIMTTAVVTTTPEALIGDVAQAMLRHRISALPVVDFSGKLVGMVSEGDLQRRAETGTERHRSWWLELIASNAERAHDFEKFRGRHVRNVMTSGVATVTEDAPLAEIAEILETRHIKRVPVLRDGHLVGIVSRADLLRGLAVAKGSDTAPSRDDAAIRQAVLDALGRQEWLSVTPARVLVDHGVVHLWGHALSEEEVRAMRVVAENVPGVQEVLSHMVVVPMATFQPVGTF